MTKINHTEIIKKRLLNEDWPNYTNPDRMAELDGLADDALSISKIDATTCIASILILQQMTEELIKVLLESSRLLMQVQLLPLEITFKPTKKAMFGELLKQLESSINFQYKIEIIKISNIINTQRIEVAHKLIQKDNLDELQSSALEVRNNFESFLQLFDISYSWIVDCLDDLKKLHMKEYASSNQSN